MTELSAVQTKYRALEIDHSLCASRKTSTVTADVPGEMAQPVEPSLNDVDKLKAQIQELGMQKNRLEEALRSTQYDKISYTNALSNANSHNRTLADDLTRAEDRVKSLTTAKDQLEKNLAEAQSTLDATSRECEHQRDLLKHGEETHVLESEKIGSLQRELRSLDKLLNQRDEECKNLHRTLLVQTSELDRLRSQLISSSSENDPDIRPSEGLSAASDELKWMNEERAELRRNKEELITQVMKLEEDLEKTRAAVHTAERETIRLTDMLATANQEKDVVEQALQAKKRDHQALQEELAACKETLRKAADDNSQAHALLSHADDVENEKLRLQHESLTLKRRFEELRDENASLKSRVESGDTTIKRQTDHLQELRREVTLLTKRAEGLQHEKDELSTNYEAVVIELRNARQSWQYYQREYERLSSELQTHQQSLSSGETELKSTLSSVGELRNRVHQLESELRVRQSQMQQLETRLQQEKAGQSNAQNRVVVLQDELAHTKELYAAREATLRELRDNLLAKERSLTEKDGAVENLRLLVEQMESSRDQIVFQLKQRQQQIQRQNEDMDRLGSNVSSMEKQLAVKDNEIKSLKQLTRTLDNEKDLVNDSLDVLTERCHELENESRTLRESLEAEKLAVKGLQDQLSACVSKLNDRDEESSNLKADMAQMEKEMDRLEQYKAMHAAELAALTQDLENMTIENQSLSEECARLQYAHRSHGESTTSMKRATRQIERDRDALQIELEDLKHTYRSLVAEHEGMQRARHEINELQDDLTAANEELRRQVASQGNQLEMLKEKLETMTTEAATYREQVSFLTDKLQQSQEKYEDLEAQMDRAAHELDTQKQISTEISAQRYGAQAENAAVSQRIVHLEAKLTNSKYELQTLREKLRLEQSQRRSLENLVSTLRQKAATNDSMISHLEEQRNVMAQEIQATVQRRAVSGSVSPASMDMAELNHTPPSQLRASSRSSSVAADRHKSPDSSAPSSSTPENAMSTPESLGQSHGDSSSSILPLRALEQAQRKCQELEDRLGQQDDTIKVCWRLLEILIRCLMPCDFAQHLERSRSKFKRFAAKYERELEQVSVRWICAWCCLRSHQVDFFSDREIALSKNSKRQMPLSALQTPSSNGDFILMRVPLLRL